MRLKLFLTISILLTSVVLFSQSLTTSFRGTKIVDGIVSDWGSPLRYYDADAHLQYAIANDDSLLYLCFRVTEPEYQMKILKGGMTVYIDTTGKKKENISITCPIPGSIKSIRAHDEVLDEPLLGRAKSEGMQSRIQDDIALAFSKYALTGFRKDGVFYSNMDSSFVKVAAGYTDFNALIVEYSVRITSFYKPLQPSDATKKFSLLFVINGLTRPNHDDLGKITLSGGGMGGGGFSQGGRGQMGGGGMSGGGGMGRDHEGDGQSRGFAHQAMAESSRTRVKLLLSVK